MRDEAQSIIALLTQRIAADVTRLLSQTLAPGLYLVATPIGNLADVTVRALTVLAAADVIYCEDTRHSRGLLTHFGINNRLTAYHEHNAERERPRILALLAEGQAVALISDAGTPLVSDPGYKLVRDCATAGFDVFSIPGPSAVLGALVCAGLPTDCFLFAGFLPAKSGQRKARLAELALVPATLIFYEAPTRLAASLADMASVLGDRPVAVARELTKLHETVLRGTLHAMAVHDDNAAPRGEIAIVVGPPAATIVSDDDIVAALERALASQSLRDAVKTVAEMLGVPKARVYDIGLEIKRGGA